MDKSGRHIVDEMWRELRDGVVQEWERLMDVKPDVTKWHVRLHSLYGSLEVRFDPQRRNVQLAVRPCCKREDCPTPVSERDLVYKPVVTSGGRRAWRRASYEHPEKRMAHLIIYHLLKYREPV